jgi:lipoprotein-releasing system permease protein
MAFESFIARRMLSGSRLTFSKPVVRIAMLAVAIGLAAMIISYAVVRGFQTQIAEKITGFASDIQVARFDENNSFEYSPLKSADSIEAALKIIKGVKHVQPFCLKAGIIKTSDEIQGVVLKGIGKDFDWSFFNDKIVDGHGFRADTGRNDSVIISEALSQLLKIKVGDPLRMYFIIENQARARRFIVSGVYNTHLEEFDKLYVFGDINQIRKLNGWDANTVSGFDIYVNDFKKLDETGKNIYDAIGYNLNAKTIKELYPQLFSWLNLLDTNVIIILVLMILVSVITLISTLLILILERTTDIGVLKALGAANVQIRKIFMLQAFYIITLGLIIGNIIGVGFVFLQQYTGMISLPADSYFMNKVPVAFEFPAILIFNAGTIIICMLALILPTVIISRIMPANAIRFE